MFEFTQTSQFWLYFVRVAGIVVLPGMDMAFVMASARVDGRRAGAARMASVNLAEAIQLRCALPGA